MSISKEEFRAHLRELLPQVLRDEPSLRQEIYLIISETLVTRSETEAILAELRALREASEKRFEAFEKRFEAFQEASEKRFEAFEKRLEAFERRFERFERVMEEHARRIEELSVSHNELRRTVAAVGNRWGVLAEEAFRAGMRGVLEGVLGPVTVERWRCRDEKGLVYGAPADIEVDLVIRNGKRLLVEIKSSASSPEVGAFYRICQLYSERYGPPDRCILLSPFVTSEGRRLAQALGIELYTGVSS